MGNLLSTTALVEKGNVEYIEGGRTFDTLRYGKTESKLPFVFTFTDKLNCKWQVTIDKDDDVVNFCVPCGTQMLWYGGDESPTRTGSDAQTDWAHVEFSYQGKTMLPPWHAGVRIAFVPMKDTRKSEWKVDTERWQEVLNRAEQGVKITGSVIEQAGKVAAMCG